MVGCDLMFIGQVGYSGVIYEQDFPWRVWIILFSGDCSPSVCNSRCKSRVFVGKFP